MADKLKTFDFTAPSAITTATEKAVYPWEEWLDGDIWQLTEGQDFETHPLMMERIIRTRATARHAKVRLRHQPLNGDSPFGVIIVQRTDVKGPSENKKAAAAAARAEKRAAAEKEAAKTLRQAGIKPSKKAVSKNGVAKTVARKAVPPQKSPNAPSKRPARKVSA